MKTLVVAALYPWPASDGYRQRLTNVVGGLCQAGAVDLCAPLFPGAPPPEPSPWSGVDQAVAVRFPAPRGPEQWFPEWVRGELPRRVLAHDWSLVRRTLADLADRDYDLVWYSIVDPWCQTNEVLAGIPSVVDFDNLEHLALRLRRQVPPPAEPGAGALARGGAIGRWAVSRGFDLVDERRWDRLQRRCAAAVDSVVVCSALDARRAGVANAVVLPNGADAPPHPVTDRTVLRSGVPTLGFVGALDYEPNREAVDWFVREVFPAVRRRRPDARFRVVGRGGETVSWVAGEPGVDLVGRVEDLQAELDRTDVSVVPIRVGAGTRLKVVEALANHLPLATTTVGCEGIDLVDGTSALIADDADGLADACVRLLDDGGLRQRLADEGAALFEEAYTWASIRERVAGLARRVAGTD
jgi:polysaccharide biosynthesis protein PslH